LTFIEAIEVSEGLANCEQDPRMKTSNLLTLILELPAL
jgi:hypothetical protein